MIFWLVLALIAIAVTVTLAWPLILPPSGVASRLVHDLAVYRDQLAELERERARGAISETDAASARLEIERRILAADDGAEKAEFESNPRRHWPAVAGMCVLVPGFALGLYLTFGAPDLPDQPLAARANDPDVKLARLAAEIGAKVAAQPSAAGYAALGTVDVEMNDFDGAADAYRKAIALGDNSADTYSALGQAITLGDGGGVMPDARTAFLKAQERDPTEARSRFYLGLAEAQIGNPTKALAIWRDLEKDSPAGSPWLGLLDQNIARIAQQTGIDPRTVAPDSSDITRQIKDMESQSHG